MEYLRHSLKANVSRRTLHGREYIVAPLTLIVPGVLNGSKGPLYYPPEEIAREPGAWNGIPLVVHHPGNGSARTPEVAERQEIGRVYNARVESGRLRADGWFDVERTRQVNPWVLSALERGEKIELSTGLYTEDVSVGSDARDMKGRPYKYIATNYRPDHVAILPSQKGACSIDDGCGVNNKRGKSTLPYQSGRIELTEEDRLLGKEAEDEARSGVNPPSWAVDEAIWEKAKAVMHRPKKKGGGIPWNDYTEPYAVLVHIYKNMGGTIGKKSGKARNMAANTEVPDEKLDDEFWDAMGELVDTFEDEDEDEESDEYIENRTAAIRKALKAISAIKRSNKRKWLSGAKGGFKVGGKTVSRQTFARKIGGVPESYKENSTLNQGGTSMDKESLVNDLIANGCCWEESDRQLLLGLDNERLKKLHAEAVRVKAQDALVANLEKGLGAKLDTLDVSKLKPAREEPPPKGPLTENEWLETAPPSVRDDLAFARRIKEEQRRTLIKKITANTEEFSNEELEKMPEEILCKMAAAFSKRPAANYLGAGTLPESIVNREKQFAPFGLPQEYLKVARQ